MTDEEFERLKAAEKEHLRAETRLRATLDAVKRRTQSERVVQQMKRGAERLLGETEALVDGLRQAVARGTARLESALDDASSRDGSLDEAEEVLREERAETLLRRYKASPSAARRPRSADDENPDAAGSAPDGPEKTIGRMRTPRSDEGDDAS